MGFLYNFFDRVFREDPGIPVPVSLPAEPVEANNSFELLDEEAVDSHLRIARYSDFLLTDAVRPSYDLQVIPRQAYRHDSFSDGSPASSVPVLMVSASSEWLFELFLDLLEPLGDQVDVVLETSHAGSSGGKGTAHREHIDMPVLKSILCEYENMLLHDGCLGIAVLNPNLPLEVQFDEHKLLIIYGQDLGAFESILTKYRIVCDEEVKFITEGEHVHASREEYAEDFEILKRQLGMETSFGTCR